MTVRQTNVIWVAFTLATCLLDEAARLSDKKLEDRSNRPFTTDCLLGDLEGPGETTAATRYDGILIGRRPGCRSGSKSTESSAAAMAFSSMDGPALRPAIRRVPRLSQVERRDRTG